MAALSGVWRYDSSQVIAAPASGYLRTNASPVSQMAVSATTKGGANVHADLVALTSGAFLVVQEVSDATAAAKYQLTGPVVDNTTWVQLAVAVVAYTPAVQPPRPNQDILVTGQAAVAHAPYTTLSELQRVLQKPAPTAAETTAMQRVLDVAAREIDWDLAYDPDNPPPASNTPEYALLAEVNLDRAGELWAAEFRPFGATSAGPDVIPLVSPRDTWYRHHLRLNPLRTVYPIG